MPARDPDFWGDGFDPAAGPSPLGSHRPNRGPPRPDTTLILAAAGLVLVLVLAIVVLVGPNADHGEALHPNDGKAFDPNDFQWPQLMEALYYGDADPLAQPADWQALTLYYLSVMNDYLGDSNLGLFHDPRCFTGVHQPLMKGKLTAALLTWLTPQFFNDLLALGSSPDWLADARRRFPWLAGHLEAIAGEVQRGSLNSLIYALQVRQIMTDRATKDAAMLLTQYGCARDGVTHRIYGTAYRLIDDYSTQGLGAGLFPFSN